MHIYTCKDEFDNILCGVYDAWYSGYGHAHVKLEIAGDQTMELFAEYNIVETDPVKARKVSAAILRKLSTEIFENVYKVAMSSAEDRAEAIYRYLVRAFRVGPGIISHLQEPEVMRVFEICRFVSNETHLLLGFIRFQELSNGILMSEIEPKNRQLTLVAPHFADRLSGENWLIADRRRQEAVIHVKNGDWILTDLPQSRLRELQEWAAEDRYEDLWQTFFQTIAIAERKNPRCQRGHLPLRYRPVMTEFQTDNSKKEREKR